jgi:hypothetical protein
MPDRPAARRREFHRSWCVEVIDAVLRWDHRVSVGEQEGPMPATLAASLIRVRGLLTDPEPSPMVDALVTGLPVVEGLSEPHALVYNDGPVCWCGENHNKEAS